jgi:hypothetical protein
MGLIYIKKMNKYNILTFLGILFIVSCNSLDDSKREISHKIIKVDEVRVDKIILDSIITVEAIYEFNIPDSLILGKVSKVINTQDYIIVLDKFNNSIFIFDYFGNYLSKINKQGKGPGEYIKIDNLSITEHNNSLYFNVIDRSQKKVLIYNIKGENVSEIQLDGWPSDYLKLGGTDYISNYSHIETRSDIYYLDLMNSNKKVKGFFPYYGYVKNMQEIEQRFIKLGNSSNFYYRNFLDNKLYSIIDDTLKLSYEIDLGPMTYPSEKILKHNDYDAYKKFTNENKFIGPILNIYITNSTLYLNYFNNYSVYYFISDLKDYSRSIHFNSYQYSRYGISVEPASKDGDYFYSILNSWKLTNDQIENINKDFNFNIENDSDKSFFVKYKYNL